MDESLFIRPVAHALTAVRPKLSLVLGLARFSILNYAREPLDLSMNEKSYHYHRVS
jgi:hypothetical protein